MPITYMVDYNNNKKQQIAERIKKIQIEKQLKDMDITLRIITDGSYPECQSYLKSKITHGKDCLVNVEVIIVDNEHSLKFWINDSISKKIPMIFQLPSRKEFENIYMSVMKNHAYLDMDGFFDAYNLMSGDYTFAPCTPKGVLDYLKNGLNIDLRGKNVVIVGRGALVGKPLSVMMINEGATVSVINSKTEDKMRTVILEEADVVILASGVKGSVAEDELAFHKQVYVMNVGIVFTEDGKLDTELEVVGQTNILYSDRIRAVGVATVISLMDNVCNFYEKYR